MKTSSNAHEVMHYFEDCKLLAYPDPASALFKACLRAGIDPFNLRKIPSGMEKLSGAPWTNGWGDTGSWKLGDEITQADADRRFEYRLANEFEPMAEKAITRAVSQAEFDGFVSALYNIGPGGPKRDGLIMLTDGRPSTVLRKLNAGDDSAWDSLLAWDKAGGVSMLGLKRRRYAERAVGRGATGAQAIQIAKSIR